MQMCGSPKAVRKIKVHAVPACEHDGISSTARDDAVFWLFGQSERDERRTPIGRKSI